MSSTNGHAPRHLAVLAESDLGLAAVREYVKAHTMTPLVNKLTAMTGTTVKKQQLHRWLTTKEGRHVEPGFGMGRLMVKAVEELKLNNDLVRRGG